MTERDKNFERACEIVQEADALLVTAGAGMGVDSGLPDFRGNEGFWKAYPPMKKLGKGFMDMANPVWFRKDPKIAWGFYGHRLNLYRSTVPHEGFHMLMDMGKRMKHGLFVFTSNVDGQFQKAGFDTERIVECHGTIHHFQCSSPCSSDIWDASGEKVIVDEERFLAEEPFPKCRRCGEVARPNILMFGDFAWNSERTSDQESRLEKWLSDVRKDNGKFVVIETGAGEAVATVRMTSEGIARNMDGSLIRINPRDFHVPAGSNVSIAAGGLEGIEGIYNRIIG